MPRRGSSSLARRGIGLDYAHESRKKQDVPIPRLGGMPLMLATSMGLLVIFAVRPSNATNWFPILLGSLMMYGLGLWDDLRHLGAKVKLAGQIVTAVLVYSMGLNIEKFTYPGARAASISARWSLPVTVFWLIAVPNIVNLIDGFDGLAGGLGLCMSVTLGIVGLHNEQMPVACYAFTLAGALLGFLVFNFPPAKIYLGDGGAYLIGFTIAALSLTSSNKGSVAKVLFVTLIALGRADPGYHVRHGAPRAARVSDLPCGRRALPSPAGEIRLLEDAHPVRALWHLPRAQPVRAERHLEPGRHAARLASACFFCSRFSRCATSTS